MNHSREDTTDNHPMFRLFTMTDDSLIMINMALVRSIRPASNGVRLHFAQGETFLVKQSFHDMEDLL